MKRFVVYPYKMSSEAAKLLAERLGVKRVRQFGGYKPRKDDIIINYGNAHEPNWAKRLKPSNVVLNHWDSVAICCDKLLSFNTLRENKISIPDFTTDIEVAKTWITKHTVFCRTVLNGHSGLGIVVATKSEELVPAPLYVKYIKKIAEYRIVVFGDVVIDVIQKKRRVDYNGKVDPLICSYHKGWVFTRDLVNPPKCVLDEAVKTVKALKLDFGGVDIVFNKHYNKAYVLEGNTACGIASPTSLKRYTDAFNATLKGEKPKEFTVVNAE